MKNKSVTKAYTVVNIVPDLSEEERRKREMATAKIMYTICMKHDKKAN